MEGDSIYDFKVSFDAGQRFCWGKMRQLAHKRYRDVGARMML